MIEQVFEAYRKASEAAPQAPDWARTVQKRSFELVMEAVGQHRQALDSTCRRVVEVVDLILPLVEATAPEKHRRLIQVRAMLLAAPLP